MLYDTRVLDTNKGAALALEWSTKCANSHETCNAVRGHGVLPKRILDLATSVEDVSLYVTQGESVPYATLSYCWGSATSLKTLSSNLDAHRHGIPIEAMPTTLQDAVRLARAMGFRYLWIDALCIVQDDPADWAEQSAAMTDIYQRCTVNIAALDALDCDQGLVPKLSNHSRVLASSAASGDPSYTRGWVFQETLVSPATLRCTSAGIQWECCQEGWADLIRRQSTAQPSPAPIYTWHQYVAEFADRRLSVPTDKLPAMAGVAARFSHLFNLTYAAGLWREHFLSGLTWGRTTGTSLVRRVDRAPSWSWASVDGQVAY
ncbi:heterokaryon incompatibility protein-domain-containing protein, partial [Microdochium trichocladiopsis]